ncbi:MAG: DUF2849 domain-containing protein [Pseudomonadota bacterium]
MKSVTANDLTGGYVVFLATGGAWSKYIEDAALFSDDEGLTAALAQAERDENRQIIVGPYAIEMELNEGRPSPARLREKIRANGPTAAYGSAMRLEGFYAA